MSHPLPPIESVPATARRLAVQLRFALDDAAFVTRMESTPTYDGDAERFRAAIEFACSFLESLEVYSAIESAQMPIRVREEEAVREHLAKRIGETIGRALLRAGLCELREVEPSKERPDFPPHGWMALRGDVLFFKRPPP